MLILRIASGILGFIFLSASYMCSDIINQVMDAKNAKSEEELNRFSYIKTKALPILVLVFSFVLNIWMYLNIAWWEQLLLSVSVGVMLSGAKHDEETMQIYDSGQFISFIFILPVLIHKMVSQNLWRSSGLDLAVVIIILLVIGRKLFGLADVFMFINVSMAVSSVGGRLLHILMMMFLAYVILLIPQLIKKNVNRKGNLKEKRAFAPSIFAAFIIMLTCGQFIIDGGILS